ncbi:MAG: TonB-dependent receptor [Pseudomonadales bacterium]
MMFQKKFLSSAIALALIGTGTQAWAQENSEAAEEPRLEEVTVTGIRSSLKRSMDMKRNADGIVDGISSEDIGKFPDTNLAESLQRITGVAIDRSRGEGSRVTVRGFGPDFNLVTLNGRQMPTANSDNTTGRSFDFGDIASEGISAVEVYKSGKANVPTGGIGSTINIKTHRPLDHPGLKFTFGAKGVHDTSTETGDSLTPELSGLYSNTFADDTFGVSLTASYQERHNGANTAAVGGWRTFPGSTDDNWCAGEDWCGNTYGNAAWGGIPKNDDQINRPLTDDETYSVPQVITYESAEYRRTRINGQLALQWAPTEEIKATLDYTYSEVEHERTFNTVSAWFNFANQASEWTDGPQASPIYYTENLPGTIDMGAGADATKNENESVGLNLEWTPNDNLTLGLDYHNSSAKSSPNSPNGSSSNVALSTGGGGDNPLRSAITGHFTSDLPVLEIATNRPLTPEEMIVTGSVFINQGTEMDIEQAKLYGTYEFDWDNGIESIDFGVQATTVDNQGQFSVVQREAWGGVTQPGAIADLLSEASTAGDYDEISGGNDARRWTDYYTYDMNAMIQRTEELMASGDADIWTIADMGDCGTGFCPTSNVQEDRLTSEEQTAAYFQVNYHAELGYMPFNAHLGVRYEKTEVESSALSPTYSSMSWITANEFAVNRAVDGNGDPVVEYSTFTGDYDNWLPNLDLDLGLTDDVVLRASISKTMTRPNYKDIQGGLTIAGNARVDGGSGARGNPALLPFESLNFDLSLEWYYGESSYASIGYFRKDVENFIGTSISDEGLFGIANPGSGPLVQQAALESGSTDLATVRDYILENFDDEPGVDAANDIIFGISGRDDPAVFHLTIPTNIEKAVMKGWEIAVQHNFGESGFGVIANATLVEADVGYDNSNLAGQFVLSGLGDTANLIGFYDKYGVQVRIAYSWRDDYLEGVGQANDTGGPTYVEAYAQVDMSASYAITDSFQVLVEGINITDSTRRLYGRTEMQTLFATQTGPRYNIGVRYTY